MKTKENITYFSKTFIIIKNIERSTKILKMVQIHLNFLFNNILEHKNVY